MDFLKFTFYLCGVLLLGFGIYLFLIMPRIKKADIDPIKGVYFAHRGYYSLEQGIPQNTLEAFTKAVEHGFGIELDVHLTKDGNLAVIHDENLKNLCNHDGIVEEMTMPELKKLRIQGTACKIPTFREVLELVAGKVPLLVEVKGFGIKNIMPAVMAELDNYKGLYCIESFNPSNLRWLKKHRPEILRGQLACKNGWQHIKDLKTKIGCFISEKLLFNFMGRPDFIAYSFEDLDRLPVRLCKKMGAYIAGWTIKEQEDVDICRKKGGQVFIFENINPPKEKL